ncbi:MAG TPA: tetratricopeptide repeat protein [Pyrinomonadaceae bacterium]|jgi:tetratricopeptide (TPR) repeat protein/tRNA A-37 threonylcarbamoyl transferase component Bud32
MANTFWQKIDEIFPLVADLPPEERELRLDELCEGDEELRREISSMLAVDEKAAEFIETPVILPNSLARAFSGESGSRSGSNGKSGKSGNPYTLELAGRQIGAYRIVRKLGAGGMGAVYLAERSDGEFRKRVAIKLVKSGADTAFNLRRFRHERQILAALEHPNISRLLDGGTTLDGSPYFVMEYVEGKPLFDYCDERNLDLHERLGLFRQILAAVAYAHERGVVHRDIKPGNILVARDGSIRLLDFGIAKILDANLIHGAVEQTETLFRQMTPEYASPEQICGEEITAASDIYSLGVVLHEFISGERPYKFTSRAPHEIARVICEQEVESFKSKIQIRNPADSQPAIYDSLEKIVLKTLRKKPMERYASVAALDGDLERILYGLPVLTDDKQIKSLENAGGNSDGAAESVSLAVSVFQVLSIENDDLRDAPESNEFLGIGLADALTTKLSGVRRIAVRPTSSVLPLAKLAADALGKKLSADFVLAGRILRGDGRIRVTVQLFRVENNSVLWAQSFDEAETDIFRLQDSISERVAASLVPQLTREEQAVLHYQGTTNAAAYEAYLRGRVFFYNYTFGGISAAENCFQQAIALDPNFALAHSALADFYNLQTIFGVTSNEKGFTLAKKFALKAIELDPDLAEALTALAFTTWAFDWDFAEAERLFQKAIRLNPNYARAHEWYAFLLSLNERHEEAESEMRRAELLDPNSPGLASMVSLVFYNARHYEEAYRKARRALELDPDYYIALQSLGWICPRLGKFDEAVESCRRAVRICDQQAINKFSLALALIDAGQTSEARSIAAELEKRRETEQVPAYYPALVYAYLGEDEKAFEWLDEAIKERGYYTLRMRVEPRFDRLRADARFARRLAAVKAPGESNVSAPEQKNPPNRHAANLSAEEAYRRGRAAAYSYTFEGIAASEKYFQEAIASDPNFAPAYSGLADFYNWQTIAGLVPPASVFPAAKRAARRAVELDPNCSEGYASLAFATWAYDWDFAEAERLYRKSIALDPKNAKAREWFSYLLTSIGRHDEAVAEMQRAERLAPDSEAVAAMFGLCFYYGGRYEESYQKLKRSLELDPNYYLALMGLGWVSPVLGRFEEAIEGARRAVEISDELSFNKFSLALALIAAGQTGGARSIAAELEKRRRERFAPAYFLALIYANLNESETALRWLDEAIKERGYWTLWLLVEPRFARLRDDSRFAERLARVKTLNYSKPAISNTAAASPTEGIQTSETVQKPGKFRIKAAALLPVFAALILVAVYAATNFLFFEKRTPAENSQTHIATQTGRALSEKPRTNNSVADGLYLAGKQQLESSSEQSNDKAIEFFNEAIKLDPDFAHAYSGLANAYLQNARAIDAQPEAAYRKAEEYAVKAIALNPDLAEARISLGMAVYRNTKNFEQAEKHFLRAIEINPSLSAAHHWYGVILIETGRVEDAIREIKIAAELEPSSAAIHYTLGAVLFNEKKYAEAIPHFDRAIENSKNFAGAYGTKAIAQQILGDYDGALETYRSVRIINGEDENEPAWLLMQAQAHAGMGRREQSLAALNRFFQTTEYRKDPLLHLFNRAVVYNLLGETDKAFACLEKIEGKSSEQINLISRDPRLANLHRDPRFQRLIEKWEKQAASNANKS